MSHENASASELRKALGTYEAAIAPQVVEHLLATSGCECESPELSKLVAVAAQRFVSDVLVDAKKLAEIRARGSKASSAKSAVDAKVLAHEDVVTALGHRGIDARQAPYFLAE